jgi:hypothetical protein
LGRSVHTIKTQRLLVAAREEIGLKVEAEKTKYVVMS